jgi:hypothetical protein
VYLILCDLITLIVRRIRSELVYCTTQEEEEEEEEEEEGE